MKRLFALRTAALAAAAFAAPLAWAHPGHGVTDAGMGFGSSIFALFHFLAHVIETAGVAPVAILAGAILAIGLLRAAGRRERVTDE